MSYKKFSCTNLCTKTHFHRVILLFSVEVIPRLNFFYCVIFETTRYFLLQPSVSEGRKKEMTRHDRLSVISYRILRIRDFLTLMTSYECETNLSLSSSNKIHFIIYTVDLTVSVIYILYK